MMLTVELDTKSEAGGGFPATEPLLGASPMHPTASPFDPDWIHRPQAHFPQG